MGDMIRLTAADGHTLDAYRATPDGTPRAGLVVLQEIFGLTGHIRRVADDYAQRGYLAIAPALFDRVKPGTVLDYTDIDEGRSIMQQLALDDTVHDIAAAADEVRAAGSVAVVGYCWGGAMADLAACRVDIDAAAAYYGRMIVEWLDLVPGCPVIYHFGEADPLIPAEMIDRIHAARPDGVFHVYRDAGHGFNCDGREDFNAQAAKVALDRTLEFFGRHL